MSAISAIFIAALIHVESSGNNVAIGDGGKAYGCLQIHPAVVKDVNRIYGAGLKHTDMFDRDLSVAVCRKYLEYYGSTLPRTATLEDYARIWNGGPNGWRSPRTKAYWKKVQHAMQTLPPSGRLGNGDPAENPGFRLGEATLPAGQLPVVATRTVTTERGLTRPSSESHPTLHRGQNRVVFDLNRATNRDQSFGLRQSLP